MTHDTRHTTQEKAGGLFKFSVFLVVCTALLILAGGLVTSHEAGLAVPDWPLSYGQYFPPMVGNVFWEHGHRMIAGTVAILTLLLAIFTQRSASSQGIKRLGWIMVGTVILQALLGGLTVLLLLPDAVSIFHACLAQTFFCLAIAMAYLLSGRFPVSKPDTEEKARYRKLVKITIAFIFLQLIFGANARHSPHGIELHIVNAFIVTGLILLVVLRGNQYHDDPAVGNLSALLGGLTVIQFFLGFSAFVFTRLIEHGYAPSSTRVIFTAAHQTTGALVLGGCVWLAMRLRRDQ